MRADYVRRVWWNRDWQTKRAFLLYTFTCSTLMCVICLFFFMLLFFFLKVFVKIIVLTMFYSSSLMGEGAGVSRGVAANPWLVNETEETRGLTFGEIKEQQQRIIEGNQTLLSTWNIWLDLCSPFLPSRCNLSNIATIFGYLQKYKGQHSTSVTMNCCH